MGDSKTDVLRELLDERGVEYAEKALRETEWTVNGIVWHANEYDGKLNVYVRNNDMLLTPEQAIAATLGSECKDLLLKTFGLARMMYDCWLEECKAGDNVDLSACHAYLYEFDQIAQAMFDAGIDPSESGATLGSEREKELEKLVQKALDEGWCDEWWYEDARKLGLEANY